MVPVHPSVSPRHLLEQLRTCQADLQTVQGSSSTPLDLFNAYNRWANQYAHQLSFSLLPAAVDRMITTRRYWLIQGIDPAAHGGLRELLDLEVNARLGQLTAAIAELNRDLEWVRLAGRDAIVPDTNFLLEHYADLDDVPWPELIGLMPSDNFVVLIPLAVVRELDRLKRVQTKHGKVEVKTQARLVLRWLAGITEMTDLALIHHEQTNEGRKVPRGRVGIVPENLDHVPLASADAEIIDRTTALSGYFARVHLLTYDRAMALLARQASLTVHEQTYPDQ